MEEKGIDALLVASPVNGYYFTGLDSLIFDLAGVEQDVSWALVLRRKAPPTMILPYQFRKSFEAGARVTDIKIYQGVLNPLGEISRIWKELGLEKVKVGAELKRAHQMHGEIFLELAKSGNFVDGTELISTVRMVKSNEELDRMRKAARIANRAFERLVPKIKVGMTEREIIGLLCSYMHEEGAPPYYATMRSGERYLNKLILSRPSDYRLKKGDWLLFEWGAEYRRYATEAKTIALLGAKPSEEDNRLYSAYLAAMKKAVDTARPGATCSDVYEAEKRTFIELGYKVEYPFRMGHGTGMEAHELPDFAPTNKTKLVPGIAFAAEPWGIGGDKAKIFGVSNTTIVTSGAAERLPPFMEEIIQI